MAYRLTVDYYAETVPAVQAYLRDIAQMIEVCSDDDAGDDWLLAKYDDEKSPEDDEPEG